MVDEQDVLDTTIEHQPPAPHRNGTNGHAGQKDAYLARDPHGNQFNPTQEAFQGSNDPIEYLPRTRITEKEIARDIRMVARHNRRTTGYTDLSQTIAWKYNARIGLNGEARKELVRMVTGGGMFEGMKRGMGGMFDRFRDVHHGKGENMRSY